MTISEVSPTNTANILSMSNKGGIESDLKTCFVDCEVSNSHFKVLRDLCPAHLPEIICAVMD